MQQELLTETEQVVSSHELSQQEIFKGVDIELVSTLLKNCPVKIVKKDEYIIQAGEQNHKLYLILSGDSGYICLMIHPAL